MKVYVNKISGIDDAIVSMFMSHRTWTPSLNEKVYGVCEKVMTCNGARKPYSADYQDEFRKFDQWFEKLLRFGCIHTTMLRFIDFSIVVEGLHRAGQDDWDSHAKRFDNRIVRTSTRSHKRDFGYELSSYYEDVIIPTDVAMRNHLGIDIPNEITVNGKEYVKRVNGYILKEHADDPDAKRGLYMLSIPSNFIFKINLCEWAHVYKLRNESTFAHPEVRTCCEEIANQLHDFHEEFTRGLFMKIKN